MSCHQDLHEKRKRRLRFQLKKKAYGKPRLCVNRTKQHIYAQIVDDSTATTLASASTLSKDAKAVLKTGGNKDAAIYIGKLIAENAVKKGVTEVVFDRSGYLYHGRVKALADSARENGLKF